MSTNLVALLGFVSAAEKYISAHAKEKGIEELINLDINKLKKQLSDELSAFDVYDNHKLVKAGEEAFEDYINDRIKELNIKKKNVIDELGEIFDVNFDDVGIENEDVAKQTLDSVFEEYKDEDIEEPEEEINYFGLDEDDETLKAISNAACAAHDATEEPVYVPASDEIDDIYNEVIEHENNVFEDIASKEFVEEGSIENEKNEEESIEVESVEEEKTIEEIVESDEATSDETVPLSQVLREFSRVETPTVTEYYSYSLEDVLKEENSTSEDIEVTETKEVEIPKTELEEALLEFGDTTEETEDETKDEEKNDLIPDFDYHYYDPSEDTSERILVNPCYTEEEIEEEVETDVEVEEENVTPSLTEEIVQEINELNEAVKEETFEYDWDFLNPSIFHYIENPGLDVVFNGDEIFEVNNDIYDEGIVNKEEQEETEVLEEQEAEPQEEYIPQYSEVIQNPGVDSVEELPEEEFEETEEVEETIDDFVQYEPIDYSHVIQNPGVDSVEELLEEEQEEVIPQYSEVISNPGADSLEELTSEEETIVNEQNDIVSNPGVDSDIEEEPQEENPEDSYLESLMKDISLDREETIVIKDEKAEIYEQISKMFPYLSYPFIKSAFDLKESLSNSYEEGEEVIVLHRANFKDVDDLRRFVEIAMMHGYDINADEIKMIVDVFMKHVNTDGLILNNIFEIANQTRLLNGQYEGYRVLTKDDE